MMAVSAGVDFGTAAATVGIVAAAAACYVLISISTVAAPIIVALAAGDRAAHLLTGVRTWLTANNATILAVLIVVMGVSTIGKGLGRF